MVVHPWLMHVQTRSCQAGGSVVRGGTRSPGHDVLVAAEWQMTARRADAPAACLAAPCRLHLPLNAENRVESARLIRDRAGGVEVRPAPPRWWGGAGTRRSAPATVAGTSDRPRDPNVLLIQTSFCLDKLWPAAEKGHEKLLVDSSSGRHVDDGQNSERVPNDAAQLRHLVLRIARR